jgi:D-3-phosphoglycerate dehydrogenase
MRYRVFVTGSGIAAEARQLLQDEQCLVETGDPADTPADLARKLRDFAPDALIVRQGQITADVQDAAPGLRVICKHGVGMDNIDRAHATRRAIPVLFTPDANFESTAEHTLALLLSIVRRIPREDARIRRGVFDKKSYDGLELAGKSLAVVGYGKIARRVCELVAPFRVSVRVYHPSNRPEPLPPHVTKVDRLDDLWPSADLVSLHCPLTPETRRLVNRDTIARMPRGVHIVNTARGALVDEADLIMALRDGHVAGAAIDVFEEEPPPANHPFFGLDTVIFSPHVGGMSDNSVLNMGLESARHVLAVLKGEPPPRRAVWNTEVLDAAKHL